MIRRAEQSDLVQIAQLSLEWEQEDITYGLVANTNETLNSYLGGYFWVVSDGNRIIGYAYGQLKSNPGFSVFDKDEQKYFELEEIYIVREYRGRGKGKTLIQTIIDELEQDGIKRILVSSANKNWKEVFEYYLKNGFNMWTITMAR
ncbi:GNAT family N-acetyltransferase [Paenibacillus lautus]|uniref:GNAT family N-acetyltransferase n=1 Tax=Paenibacillus lautus TaxID=1401 RepID=UPI003D281C09